MPRDYSRKDFLKLASAGAAGLLLNACGVSGTGEKADTGLAAADTTNIPDTTAPPPPKPISVQLIREGDPLYEELRKGYNKRFDQFPLVIALCTSTQDVAEAMRYARENKLAVAVKSGGHSMEGFSGNDGGMVINLSKMNSVTVADDDTVTAGPGCTLSHLYDEVLPKKRIVPAGSCGTVGLGGLAMGGGYGFFARKYGFTCDNLLEATMVDGNGAVRSTNDDAELLWALRGGGAGNFGVVTEMKFRSYEAPPTFHPHYFKARDLDVDRATSLLKKWFSISALLPQSCFSAFVLNGKSLHILVTNFEAHTNELQALLDELHSVVDEHKPRKPTPLASTLKWYYGSLVPVYFRNASAGFYKNFDDISGFIGDVLDKVIHTPGMIYQVNTLGGAIARPEFGEVSCYPHRAYSFLSELQAYWKEPSQETKLAETTREIQELFHSNGITAQYVNYCSRDFPDWEHAYYGENYERLQAVKKKYDPDNVIRHPQSVRVG